MRATCNKKEDNFITYHSSREKIIENVRDWEKLNPEKRKEYTIKYYKTEKGHRKRLAQQKRYREKKKLIKENEKLQQENKQLKDRINKAIERLEALIIFWKKYNPIDNTMQVEQFKGVISLLKEDNKEER